MSLEALLMEANEGFQADCTKTVEAIDEDQSRRKSGNEVVFALNKRFNRKTINQMQPSDDNSEAGQSLLRTQSLELEKQRSSSKNFIRQTKSMSTRCIINVDEFITDALGNIYENGSMFTRGSSNQMDLPLSFHLPTMHHYHEGPLGRSVTAHAGNPDSSPGWESRDIKPTLPISLRFQDVKYKVPTKGYQKDILHGVSGSVHPGEILALIGPSGGGKTTLLNLLSGRSKINSGMITYNDKPYCKSLKHRIGFVLQDDAVFPHLTVKETLIYAARLRLSKTLTREQKTERAMNVIRKLGLERCQDTIIGSSHVRGVSGGERKRVCIGNEILLNPSLLFLDEPTSGLDSATALRIVQMLHDIAKSGKTVITTIHQPSSRLFSMFDKLILLGKGSSLYSGKASEAMTYFFSLGCSPLIDMNPAEFLIDLANGNINDKSIPTGLEDRYSPQRQNLEIIKTRPSPVQVHEYLVGAYEARAVETQKPNLRKRSLGQAKLEKEPNSEEPGATWWEQFSILFTRGFKERRHEYFSAVRVTQVISTAIIIGLLWWHTSASYMGGLEDQAGLLFFISVFWGFLPLLTAIFTFPQERVMLTKERSVGMYKLSAYFAARIGTDIPLDLVLPIVFMLIVYFMAGLKPSFAMFFLTMLTIFLSILAAQGLGLTIGAAFMDVKKASTLASVILMTFMLSGGFFIQDVPSFMSWVRYVSFNYHTYKLLLRIHGSISSDGGTRSSVSMIVDNSVGAEVAALITMIVGYRLLAYFFLTRMKLKTMN